MTHILIRLFRMPTIAVTEIMTAIRFARLIIMRVIRVVGRIVNNVKTVLTCLIIRIAGQISITLMFCRILRSILSLLRPLRFYIQFYRGFSLPDIKRILLRKKEMPARLCKTVTLSGSVDRRGDYLIRSIKGVLYPCTKDIFDAS